jgi:hypothetical protein
LPDLFYSKESKEKKQTPFPFPPNLGRKIQAQNGKPKKNTIEEDHVPTQLYSIQPEKIM